ncbi:MAG: hypothetical protein PHN22_01830 [Candidatus ainarchaeum sp.]|nr:hypothetical protein [Candidatus ainarchaeum sp.]
MNTKHIWQLEIIFLCGLFVNLFVEKMLYLKILFIFLILLFVFKEKDTFVFIKLKYLYFGYGLVGILILALLIGFISNIYFITISICLVVLYFYLYKIIFNKTIGVVLKISSKKIYFKVIDPFYKSKKEFILSSNLKISKNDKISILQSSFLIKKPLKILKVLKE